MFIRDVEPPVVVRCEDLGIQDQRRPRAADALAAGSSKIGKLNDLRLDDAASVENLEPISRHALISANRENKGSSKNLPADPKPSAAVQNAEFTQKSRPPRSGNIDEFSSESGTFPL